MPKSAGKSLNELQALMLKLLIPCVLPRTHLTRNRGIYSVSITGGLGLSPVGFYSPNGNSVGGIFNPWGNPYVVETGTMDKDGIRFKIGSEIIDLKGLRGAVYSVGTDKKLGNLRRRLNLVNAVNKL